MIRSSRSAWFEYLIILTRCASYIALYYAVFTSLIYFISLWYEDFPRQSFSAALTLCSHHKIKDKISHPNKITRLNYICVFIQIIM
jgi:hypothetical protein